MFRIYMKQQLLTGFAEGRGAGKGLLAIGGALGNFLGELGTLVTAGLGGNGAAGRWPCSEGTGTLKSTGRPSVWVQ